VINKPSNNQDKSAWCEYGDKTEVEFVSKMLSSSCSVFMNPAKAENKYTHDFFIVMPSDLKTIRTRFRTSDRYGIKSHSAITLNKKDVDRYVDKYPHIIIIFDVKYDDFSRLCYAPIRDIQKAIARGVAKLHTYNERVNDNSGNAKESYVLDSMWFKEL
tara:strand:- start:44 stop:520 length:477 start_codon:yes stop_codon:yes gene_type:complete